MHATNECSYECPSIRCELQTDLHAFYIQENLRVTEVETRKQLTGITLPSRFFAFSIPVSPWFLTLHHTFDQHSLWVIAEANSIP